MAHEGFTYHHVHRALSDPVYMVRLLFIRLTEFDVFAVGVSGILTWMFTEMMGFGQKVMFFGLFYDPFLYLLVGFLLAVVLSTLHKIRPEGGTENVFRSIFQPKLLSPRTPKGDLGWRPSQRPHLRGEKTPVWLAQTAPTVETDNFK